MSNEAMFTQLGTMQQEFTELHSIVTGQSQKILELENQQLRGILPSSRESRVVDCEIFSGDCKKLKQFFLLLKNVFNVEPSHFSDDGAKLVYTVSFFVVQTLPGWNLIWKQTIQ